jgi:drug/metabolite transporter (DMT)-like permease
MLLADAALLAVALFWGIGYVALKAALDCFTPLWLTVVRFMPAFAILAVLFRRRMAGLTLPAVKAGLAAGAVLTLGFLLSTIGLVYTTAGKQAFIVTAYVVVVPILLWAVTRRFPGYGPFIAAFLCLCGMFLLTLQSDLTIGLGDGLSLLCAVCMALHMILVERYVREFDPIPFAVLQIGLVGIVAIPLALIFEPLPRQVTPLAWGSLAYNIFLGTVFALVTQNVAQKYTSSTHTALILSLEGVFGALAGALLLGELFTGKMIVGCVLIFASVLIAELLPTRGPLAAASTESSS